MVDQPLPVAAALAGIGDAIALTRRGRRRDRRRPAKPDADAGGTSTRPSQPPAHDGVRRPADARRVGGPASAELAADVADARRTSPRRSPRSAASGRGWRARRPGREATRLAVAQPRPRPRAAPATSRPAWRFPTIAELADPPVGATGDALDRRPRRSSDGSQAIADQAQQLVREMDFSFLFDPTRKLFSIGFRVRDGTLDPSYYDLLASEARLASFLAIAKGDVAAGPLVPPRPRADPGRPRLGADLVVRVDVRVPDAGARHARARRQPARPDLPARRRPPDQLRRRARRAVGHLRVGVQRARPRADLPVLELRRARPRAQARARRGRRRRPVRHGARRR